MRFAIRFVAERGQPVGRPMWASKVRNSRHYYDGVDWKVTAEPEQADTWAKASTAANWAHRMSGDGSVYRFEVVVMEDETAEHIAQNVIAAAEEAEREGYAPENSPDPEFVILARAYLRERAS